MSQLDILIRRLMAQRAFLEQAALLVADMPGPVLLLGYGDGTAFDHLRAVLPRREIIVFDASEGAVERAADQQVIGDLFDTLPLAWDRLSRRVALAGFNFPITASVRRASEIAPLLAPLLRSGAIIVSEPAVPVPGWTLLPPPDGLREGRHHLYRAG